MTSRGQRKFLLALWAVLGTFLGSVRGQAPMGQTAAAGHRRPGRLRDVQGAANSRQLLRQLPLGGLMQASATCLQMASPCRTAWRFRTGICPQPEPGPLPVELAPSSHPPYTVGPPDILYIDSLRLIPRPPYRIQPLEQLADHRHKHTAQPAHCRHLHRLAGRHRQSRLRLRHRAVAYLTVDEAENEFRRHLGTILHNPQVSITLMQYRGLQQTRGQHLVRQDGTIGLGTYGSVYVAGLTLGQIKCVVENHLSKYFLNPQISVDVAAYNSKVYYVILDGGGFGQAVYKLPITGNETVLDAIANVQGLPPIASKRRIWVARPAPCGNECSQVLPVDWRAITEGGQTCTNYQIFPGDRIFVHADRLIAIDNWLSKVLAPSSVLWASCCWAVRPSRASTTSTAAPAPATAPSSA